jgi:hypothetical protein
MGPIVTGKRFARVHSTPRESVPTLRVAPVSEHDKDVSCLGQVDSLLDTA